MTTKVLFIKFFILFNHFLIASAVSCDLTSKSSRMRMSVHRLFAFPIKFRHFRNLFAIHFRLSNRTFLVRTLRHRIVGRDLQSVVELVRLDAVLAAAGLHQAPVAARVLDSADEESHPDQFDQTAQVRHKFFACQIKMSLLMICNF